MNISNLHTKMLDQYSEKRKKKLFEIKYLIEGFFICSLLSDLKNNHTIEVVFLL